MFTSFILTLSLLFPSPALGELGPPLAQVGRALNDLAADPLFRDLQLGAAVRCGSTPLGAIEADTLLYPASSAKLLSTAAALTQLPLDHTFATTLVGEVRGHVLTRAALVAGGDPMLDVEDLENLADQVKVLGIKRLDGLVVDLGHFAAKNLAPAFDQKNTDAAYRPEIPSLGVNAAAFTITVKPGAKVGEPVRVTVGPVAAGIRIDNSAKTIEGKRLDQLVVEARADKDGTRVVVSGGLGVKADAQGVKKRLFGAHQVAALTFAKALETRQIEVGPLSYGTAGSEVVVARVTSPPVTKVAATINKTSNNYMAEALFLQLGGPHPGARGATWDRAQDVVTQTLADLGVPRTAYEIVNGSGLYEATRVTPAGLATLLSNLDPDAASKVPSEVRRAFWDSLAIAGTDGTLSHRLKGLEKVVRGKTGTLDRAISLSGYVDHPNCRLSFAFIVNGPLSKSQAKIVKRLDQAVRDLAASERGPDRKPKRRN